jgi:hypothetical protein
MVFPYVAVFLFCLYILPGAMWIIQLFVKNAFYTLPFCWISRFEPQHIKAFTVSSPIYLLGTGNWARWFNIRAIQYNDNYFYFARYNLRSNNFQENDFKDMRALRRKLHVIFLSEIILLALATCIVLLL